VIVAGSFIVNGSEQYGMAEIDLDDPTTPIFLVRTNGESNGNSYNMQNIVACPAGKYFATGYFQISGKSYNVIEIDPLNGGVITPVYPPNINGLNNPAAAYVINSVNIDDNGNIYLSGQFGVTASGTYQSANLIKVDVYGNYVTTVTDASVPVGMIAGLNQVSINTRNQWVYVIDTAGEVRVYRPVKAVDGNVTPNYNNDNKKPNVTVDPHTGTVTVAPADGSDGNSTTTTVTNQPADSYDSGDAPGTIVTVATGDSGDTSTTTAVTGEGGTTTNTNVVTPNGSGVDTATTTTTSDGNSSSSSSSTGSDGSGSTSFDNPDGTNTNVVTTVSDNGDGGTDTTTVTTVTTVTDQTGESSVTVVIVSTNADGDTTQIKVQLPGITQDTDYVTTVVSNDGTGASPKTVVRWRAALPRAPETGIFDRGRR
jgi:hypothetical protein